MVTMRGPSLGKVCPLCKRLSAASRLGDTLTALACGGRHGIFDDLEAELFDDRVGKHFARDAFDFGLCGRAVQSVQRERCLREIAGIENVQDRSTINPSQSIRRCLPRPATITASIAFSSGR